MLKQYWQVLLTPLRHSAFMKKIHLNLFYFCNRITNDLESKLGTCVWQCIFYRPNVVTQYQSMSLIFSNNYNSADAREESSRFCYQNLCTERTIWAKTIFLSSHESKVRRQEVNKEVLYSSTMGWQISTDK